MKCRFFLIDINEDRSEAKPTARLWGLDDAGNRVLILSSMIMPYFYYVPDKKQTAESARERILETKSKFPKILQVEAQKGKLFGRQCDLLKITCSDLGILSSYAKAIRKTLQGSCYEDDLRLSVRYLIDTELTACGWQEFEVEPRKSEPGDSAVDRIFIAKSLPSRIVEETPPKLRVLAFGLLTAGERGSANPKKDPIRAIVVAANDKAEVFVNEGVDDTKVISEFIAFHNRFDPDLVVGFESNGSAWPYIIQRCKLRNTKLVLGRDGSEPHTSLFGHVSIAGRANLDLSDIANGIPEIKVKTIENLAKHLRTSSADEIETIDELERYQLWVDTAKRKWLIENVKSNTAALLELAEVTIDFPMQLSALTGLPLDQVMTAAVGFRVDSYLMKQAHMLGELVPRRVEQPYFTYRGAIVLEPETGIHEDVVVLDFSSMYPTLMEKYNLSPDTLVAAGEKASDDAVFTVPEVNHRFWKQPDGFYRTVLRKLLNERERIKSEMKEAGEKSTLIRVLKERERAVKIITNACYGYAGWAGARWYAKEVAESAAAIGRDTITRTIRKANTVGLKVIYGDTDSIFVKNDRDRVDRLVRWVDEEFGLEIRREREYVRVLFTEAMKRYAGLLRDDTLDIVGLEVVRGDWSDIARQVQEQVLVRVLRDQSTEKAVEDVRATIRRIRDGEVAMSDLTIRKTLTKQIEDYKVRTPHVEVAKQLVREGWDLGVGDKVAYVIVKGSGKLFQKAKPLGGLGPRDIDVEYYVDNQIKPAAMRILERFGVSESRLAV
jgi:DNA polymerase I